MAVPSAVSPSTPVLLSLSAAARSYPGSPPVAALRPTDLRIGHQDYLSLMGRSGSGKSTLLNIMGLLDRPSAGSVTFAGTDTARMPDRQVANLRAQHIGFVFQSFNLLPQRTATENVALGLLYQRIPRSRREQIARAALDRIGLSHRAAAVPGQLSGGEKQRVAIARAVAGRPALLLCDEPTGNLDAASAATVLDVLDGLHDEGIAVVIVTHDRDVAARADRHLVMIDGTISDTERAQPRYQPRSAMDR